MEVVVKKVGKRFLSPLRCDRNDSSSVGFWGLRFLAMEPPKTSNPITFNPIVIPPEGRNLLLLIIYRFLYHR